MAAIRNYPAGCLAPIYLWDREREIEIEIVPGQSHLPDLSPEMYGEIGARLTRGVKGLALRTRLRLTLINAARMRDYCEKGLRNRDHYLSLSDHRD